MTRKPYSILTVRFLSDNGKTLSNKEYNYYIEEDKTKEFLKYNDNVTLYSFFYNIRNEIGNDYRNAKVRIVGWRKCKETDKYADYHYITQLTKATLIASTVTPSYTFEEISGNCPITTEAILSASCFDKFSDVACDALAATNSFKKLATTISDFNGSLTIPSMGFNPGTVTINTTTSTPYLNGNWDTGNNLFFPNPIPPLPLKYDNKIPYNDNPCDWARETINKEKERKEKKGNNKMFENLKNKFQFGKVDTANVKYSFYGPAFHTTTNDWVAYNKDEIVDVTGMTFDFDCFYAVPTAPKFIKKGDYILHNKEFVRVIGNNKRGNLICTSPFRTEEITVIPVKSPFGFDCFTKLVNIFEGVGDNPNVEMPFGNMLPFLMMGENKGKSKDMLPLMLMMNGNKFDMSNPLMFMMMGDKFDDMMPLMLMMNMQKNEAVKQVEEKAAEEE